MNHPKRHHYIPVMILKRFTDDDGRLWACRRDGEESEIQLVFPKNAFVEGHLYTKRDSSGNPDMSVEATLSGIEDAASPVIDRIVCCALEGDWPRLSADERGTLGRFFVHQQRRPPQNRELVETSLQRELESLPDAFERARGRPLSDDALTLLKDPEYQKVQEQNAFASFAGATPREDILQFITQCRIQFGVIRIERKSFVIGSQIGPADWFPVHQKVAFRLVVRNGPDELIEFRDMADVRRINKETVRGSLAFAGPSEQLVRSLAQPK